VDRHTGEELDAEIPAAEAACLWHVLYAEQTVSDGALPAQDGPPWRGDLMGKLLAVFALVVVLVASAHMISSGADERQGLNPLRDRVHHLSDRVEELQAVAESYKARLTEVADALAAPSHLSLSVGNR
jgi:hypothetical protein